MPIDHIHALPPGTRFEEYRLDAVLGAGGFGITYRAYDAHLDKYVAIKEYLPGEFAARTEASTVVPKSNTDAQDYHWGLTRFLDEARTLARFDHTHLNKVHRFFEANGTAYMVLEYIDGETLAGRLSRETYLEEAALQRLLDEVLSGLAVMHEAGYVHRDIKPGNMMLREEDGSAVVLDFGAARQAVGQRSKPITSILTPGYAPVEQYDGKVDRVGPWTDMYALGMVAYRCISGMGDSELPDAVARMLAHTRGEAVLLPAIEAGKGKYSPKLLEAIDWAMEVNEHNRPQSVDTWRQALAGGSRRKSSPKSVRKATTRQTSGTTTERTGIHWSSVALTVVIVALLGAGGWWGWQTYPAFFEKGDVDVAGETPQEIETGETGEAVASAEDPSPADKAAIEQPASKEPVPPAEEDEVTRLLAAAEANLAARRLTSPAWNNAWDNYQRVLELVPAHPDAIQGMEQVIESYMELFGTAVKQEAFDKAADYLAMIRELYPDSPVLEEGEGRLAVARQARAARLAEQERQRQAEEAARQAELERQRIAQAIEAHWAAFEAALEAKDLSEAAGILSRIQGLDPETTGLSEGQQRLAAMEQQQIPQAIKEHWTAFDSAIQAEDLDEATGILTRLRDLNPKDLGGLVARERRLGAALGRKRQAALVRELAIEMVSIPGGTFRMGDLNGAGYDDEKPVHSVTVPAFKLGKYEVTFAQWDACVADGGCGRYTPDDEGWGRGNRPVMNVSWDDIQRFIAWLKARTGGNFRLPTEAEWEYASRAGSITIYSWGNSIGSNRANCRECGDRWEYTAPVGSFSANAWGIHDMHGNVYERVQDCYKHSYVGAPTDSRAWTSGGCGQRVIRGGSWYNTPRDLRSAYRDGNTRSIPQLQLRLSFGPGQVDRRHYTKQSAQVFLPGFPLTFSLFPFSALRRATGRIFYFSGGFLCPPQKRHCRRLSTTVMNCSNG